MKYGEIKIEVFVNEKLAADDEKGR